MYIWILIWTMKAATDLSWGGDDRNGSAIGVVVAIATDLSWRWCGDVAVRCWRGGVVSGAVVDVVCDWLSTIWDSLTAYKPVVICRIIFWVFDNFQICWDLQVSLYPVGLFRVGVDCLEANRELGLVCLGFHSIVFPSIFGSQSYFLDFDAHVSCFWFEIGS
jgi:hypothetical protein